MLQVVQSESHPDIRTMLRLLSDPIPIPQFKITQARHGNSTQCVKIGYPYLISIDLA